MYEVVGRGIYWLTKDRTEAISIAKKNKAQVYKGKEIIKDYSEQKKPRRAMDILWIQYKWYPKNLKKSRSWWRNDKRRDKRTYI